MKYTTMTLAAVTFSLAVTVSLSGCQSPGSTAQKKYPHRVAYTPDAEPEGLITVVAPQKTQAVATSYDPRINQLETASGEQYDPMEMTAAHSSLPFSTYVKVINLENGKQTIVRVNDRLEGQDGSLKLSYAAAYRLGIYSGGKANIEIVPVGFEQTASQEVPIETLSTKTSNTVEQNPASETKLQAKPKQEAQTNKQPSLVPMPSISVLEVIRVDNPSTQSKQAKPAKPALVTTTTVKKLPTQPAATEHGSFIQIGAFRNKAYAESLLNAAKNIANATNTQLKVYETNISGQPMYKVRFGPLNPNQVTELESVVAENNFNGLTIKN